MLRPGGVRRGAANWSLKLCGSRALEEKEGGQGVRGRRGGVVASGFEGFIGERDTGWG